MELQEKITLDMLTVDGVSILRQQFIEVNGELVQVGSNIRNAYTNSKQDREQLKKILPPNYYKSVIEMWGNEPTVIIDDIEG